MLLYELSLSMIAMCMVMVFAAMHGPTCARQPRKQVAVAEAATTQGEGSNPEVPAQS